MTASAARTPSDKLRKLAQDVRNNPNHREAIADAFMLIAEQMEPCTDCGNCQGQDNQDPGGLDAWDVSHPDDNPETGV